MSLADGTSSRPRSLYFVRLMVLLPLILAACALATRLLVGPQLIDDAYITFRYARNLASGIGFVFNSGERIMGSSTPLYVVLLALLGRVGFDIAPAAYLLGISAAMATVAVTFRLGETLDARAAGIVAAIALVLAPKAVLPSVSGMETAIFTLLVCAAFYCTLAGMNLAAAALAGAAAVTRPEGILVGITLLVGMALARRKPRLGEVALLVLPLGLWIAFATTYFGTPIPHSVTAKWTLYPRYEDPLHDARQVFSYLTEPFTWISSIAKADLAGVFFGAAIVSGAVAVSRRRVSASILWIWCLMLAGGFAIGNRYIFPWYLAPMIPIVFLLGSIGVLVPVGSLLRRQRLAPRHTRILLASTFLLAVVLVAGLAAELILTARGSSQDIAARESEYASAAAWIRSQLGTEEAIAAVEIGAVGFTYPGPIIDLSGLVTPWTLAYYAEEPYVFRFPHDIPPRLIEERLPSIVVVFDGFLDSARDSGILSSQYCQAYASRLEHHAYGRLEVLIRRADFPMWAELCKERPEASLQMVGVVPSEGIELPGKPMHVHQGQGLGMARRSTR